jgi:excinuclease ABC subunit A
MLLAPLVKDRKGTYEELFERYLAQGFVRARVDGQVYQLEEKIKLDRYVKHNIELVVDRLIIKPDTRQNPEAVKRLTDSVEITLNLGEREMLVNLLDEKEDVFFSERLVDPATGQSFAEIEPHSFSFNSPHGACPACNGLGFIKEVDTRAVFDLDQRRRHPALAPVGGQRGLVAHAVAQADFQIRRLLPRYAHQEPFEEGRRHHPQRHGRCPL